MNKEEQQLFDALQLRCSKTKYRIDFIPAKEDGDRYWEFYSVDEKGYEYGRENFFSIIQLKNEVEEYLDLHNETIDKENTKKLAKEIMKDLYKK